MRSAHKRFTISCIILITLTQRVHNHARAANPPNIVLMMADDLGWGDVGFNGNKVIQTPHLDAMAAAGLKLNRFYASSPVCSPTRGSCITGRHPFRYGIYFANTGHIKPQEQTLAELLRAHGYRTGHFGKWHLGTLTRTEKDANRGGKPGNEKHFAPPSAHGFDVNFSTESKVPTYDPMIRPPKARRTWWDALAKQDPRETYGTAYWSLGKRVTENLDGDDSQVIMDRAIPFIRDSVSQKRPFFAIIWFHAPHLPVVAGPRHAKLYSQYDGYKRNYYGCVTALDDQVGRLRADLRDLGAADNTLLFFASDNGPEGNDSAPGSAGPFRGRKRSLFEGGVRVPGIIEWPARIKRGRVSDVATTTSDYLPTIVDLLDAERVDARPLDGTSLVPLIDGAMESRPAPIAFQSANQFVLSDNRYKLVHVGKKNDKPKQASDYKWMLFDVIADPEEKQDIADTHPEIVKAMSERLLEWRESCRRSDAGEDY